MAIELLPLPYDRAALEPHLSGETIDYHHGKHHKSYVDALNKLIEGTEYAEMALPDIVRKAQGVVFNNAAQVWNHNLYWNSLQPNGGGEPNGELADAINAGFGGLGQFKAEFTRLALNLSGSGWTWLIQRPDGSLALASTSNAATPLTGLDTALLTCDLWEHAYYIDYRNVRSQYIEAFWNLVNWDFAASNLR